MKTVAKIFLYKILQTFLVSGFLKPHAKKCKCHVCNDEDSDSQAGQSKKGRGKTSYEETQNKSSLSIDIPDGTETSSKDDELNSSLSAKRKKTEPVDASKKLKLVKPEVKDMRTESRPSSVSAASDETKKTSEEPVKEEKQKPAGSQNSPAKTQTFKHFSALSPPTLTTTKPTTTAAATTHSSISTFSPSSTDSLSPNFIALSTAPQISPKTTSFGSSMIPFPSKLSGIPSPTSSLANVQRTMPVHTSAYSTAPNPVYTSVPLTQAKSEIKPTMQQAPLMKQQIAIQMGPPKMETTTIMTGLPINQNHQGSYQMQRSRLGAIMQVRCKAISAYLYVTKYESGSKGKCILLGDEWLTPNEFEEKSGSKAKKYLSSIKCLGRPLRAYVNSGELRGSGPPPSPKPPRMNKPKPPQPIAPAPPPGQSHGQISLAQMSMAPPGMSPAHLTQSLTPVAMMGSVSVGGQPILINQSSFSVASTMANSMGTPILAPMTFTLAPMSSLDVRQGMQQQMHGGQHM